jgi:putative CocE/NonD family hydrolase
LGNVHWGSETAPYYRELEKQFFDYYLKGEGSMDLAEATIFDTGANQWRQFNSWPPENTEARKLYLQPEGQLAFEAPTATDSFDEYVSDPNKPVPYTEDVHMSRTREYMTDDQRFASRRPDVAVYETAVLEEAITLAGPLTATLYVSTTGTDADYVVKLIDVFPDQLDYPRNDKQVPMGGYQMLVRGEVLRGKFRNSFEQPEPFVSGEVTQVRFKLPDIAHTFKKGHKIMVQVQNSWFPLVDRNPQQFLNIYEADEEDFIKATHRIYHGTARPSSIEVRVLKEE